MTTQKKIVIFDVVNNLFIRSVIGGEVFHVQAPGERPKLFDSEEEAETYLQWFDEGIYELRTLYCKHNELSMFLHLFKNKLKH